MCVKHAVCFYLFRSPLIPSIYYLFCTHSHSYTKMYAKLFNVCILLTNAKYKIQMRMICKEFMQFSCVKFFFFFVFFFSSNFQQHQFYIIKERKIVFQKTGCFQSVKTKWIDVTCDESFYLFISFKFFVHILTIHSVYF